MFQNYQSQGLLIQQVRHATEIANGEDCVIVRVDDDSKCIGSSFPPGTTCYTIYRQSATCTCKPRCKWINYVFNYNNMTLVLTPADSEQISVATIRRLLLNE